MLISLNAEMIAERDYLKRSTLAHELGHALFDGPSMLRQAGQRAFAMVTPDEGHLAEPARGRGGMDWREFRANEFMGALLAPRVLLQRELVRRAIALGLPLRDAGEDHPVLRAAGIRSGSRNCCSIWPSGSACPPRSSNTACTVTTWSNRGAATALCRFVLSI